MWVLAGMQPSLPALDISPVKPQDLTQQEHAAESSQPKQVWGRGGDMLHVDSQRTSGVSTERLDDQHVQPTTDDLAAVADATAFPGEAPAAQTSMLARQPEHGNVKGKHPHLHQSSMLDQAPHSSSLFPVMKCSPQWISKYHNVILRCMQAA